nr:MAG TPA_asm: multi-glycosylated core protein [Caudoviricetes sp.]
MKIMILVLGMLAAVWLGYMFRRSRELTEIELMYEAILAFLEKSDKVNAASLSFIRGADWALERRLQSLGVVDE